MPTSLPLLTWVLAIAGAAFALGAALGKGLGILGRTWASRLYTLSYILMALSVVVFILRGFAE